VRGGKLTGIRPSSSWATLGGACPFTLVTALARITSSMLSLNHVVQSSRKAVHARVRSSTSTCFSAPCGRGSLLVPATTSSSVFPRMASVTDPQSRLSHDYTQVAVRFCLNDLAAPDATLDVRVGARVG